MNSSGLIQFMQRKGFKATDIARLLNCSSAVVSLYLSDRSGISLDRLCVLLKNGMSVEEAFGEEVGKAIRQQIESDRSENEKMLTEDSLSIVLDGLEKMITSVRKERAAGNLDKT